MVVQKRLRLLAGLAFVICLTVPAAARADAPTITTPPDDATYEVGQAVTVDFACVAATPCDATADGVAIDDGAPLDTSTAGEDLAFTVSDGVTSVTNRYDVVALTCEPVSATTAFETDVALTPDCSRPFDGVAVTTPAAHGQVTVGAGGTLTYTPEAGFGDADEFQYTATNADGTSPPATATVDVSPCRDQALPTFASIPVSIRLQCPGSAAAAIAIVHQPPAAEGTVLPETTTDGQVVFRPAAGFTGRTRFTFAPAGAVPAAVTVTVVALPAGGGGGGGGGAIPGQGAFVSGLVPFEDPPAEGLPAIPFLPSLFGADGRDGNVPARARFARSTRVRAPHGSVHASRSGAVRLRVRNRNRFVVRARLRITGRGVRLTRRVRLRAHRTTTVTVRLGRRQRSRLARSRRLRLRLVLRLTDPSGRSRRIRSQVILRAPTRRHRARHHRAARR